MDTVLHFPDRHAFRDWLEEHGAASGGVWLLFGKEGGPVTLSAADALEEALCFGWIDGRMQRIDDTRYKKYFARRTAGSRWSARNRKLAESLLARTLVAPPGLAAIAAAKQAGTWDTPRYVSPGDAMVRAFAALVEPHTAAFANLQAMPPSVRKTYAGFYFDAKQEKTRAVRLEKIIDRLNRNLKPMDK